MVDARFEEFLDAISRCFIERDLSLWKDRVIFPFSLVTSAGPVVISTDAQLRENFDLYLAACEAMHLDEIVREPLSLDDCKDGTWIGTYETNLLSHGVRATEPYTSSALLKEVSGKFKMLSILNARGHHDWTGKQPDSYG
jgi:hypothetical protein